MLRSKCPHALHKSSKEPVKGSVWIDTPLLVMAAAKKAEAEGHDAKEAVRQSLRRMHSMMSCLECERIEWVFDGKTRPEKIQTVHQRHEASTKFSEACVQKAVTRQVQTLCETAAAVDSLDQDLEMAEAVVEVVQRRAPPPISLIFQDAKLCVQELCDDPFQPVPSTLHIARHDSEEYIARSMKEGDVAVSSDSDALPFGCSRVVQHFGSPTETWIDLADVLDAMDMTLQQFRMFCVLLGNDFSPRLFRCGPAKCLSAVKSSNFSLETFAAANGGTEEWLQAAHRALLVFEG